MRSRQRTLVRRLNTGAHRRCLTGEVCLEKTDMDKQPIYLTEEELIGITGLRRRRAQFNWLIKNGFKAIIRADGKPIVSRSHFESIMGGVNSAIKNLCVPEPDYEALP